MKKYTRDDLFNFIWRANTHEKIEVARIWITEHVEDNNLWNDLMMGLADQSRELYRNT